jgi:hypothetical protein
MAQNECFFTIIIVLYAGSKMTPLDSKACICKMAHTYTNNMVKATPKRLFISFIIYKKIEILVKKYSLATSLTRSLNINILYSRFLASERWQLKQG